MQEHFIGRQPVIDHQGNIFAYDLFYHVENADSNAPGTTTAQLINDVLNTFGTKSILGDRVGFVTVDRAFLLSDIVFNAPKESFIFSIADSTVIDDKLVARVKELKAKGYLFSLGDVGLKTGPLQRFGPIMPLLNFFKIDITSLSEPYLAKLKKIIENYPIELVATHVDSQHQYAVTKSLRYKMVEGLYFTEPELKKSDRYDPKHFTVIQLYNLLMGDAGVDELVRAFETNHALTLQLLRYINSKAFDLANHIESIHQVITLMGREPLAQWLMLLVYGKALNTSTFQSPLLIMVRTRTELMKALLKLINPKADKERLGQAFFVGVMSLAGSVFNMPMRTILNDMHVSDEVKAALLEREGVLGELLNLVKSIEKFDVPAINAFAQKYDISSKAIHRMMIFSIQDANTFEEISKNVL